MGRDKPKKYNKMSYFQKEQWKQDEAKKRGITGETYTDYRGNTQTRVNENALKDAIRNDVDYRTSSQHMDGAKGNGNFNDFTNYERAAVKLHKQAGNEGAYSSNKDITGVTNNLVNDHNNSIADDFKSMYMNDINSLRKKLEINQRVKEPSETDPQSFEHSDAVASAKERLDDYNLSIGELNLFNPMNESPPRANDQKDAAISFADQYKMDVSDASDLGEVTARNLNNAAATVAYGR